MYRAGVLVATSPTLANDGSQLIFLSSGYAGPLDEVRVRCPSGACLPTSTCWVVDDVTFGPWP